MPVKLLTVIGARPQFIKAATVSRQVALSEDITEVIIHTGQHFDANMSDIFFDELAIPRPDHYLGIGGGSHGAMTGRQLEAIETVLLAEKPDWVLVYGDTNSTLAGALAAAKLHIPVAHVEAGLRSFNRQMPEEINRVLTDHVAAMNFSPTEVAIRNLLHEGIEKRMMKLVGDVMFDASLFYRESAREPAWFSEWAHGNDGFILATIHRAENTDDPSRLAAIFDGLGEANGPVVLPLHPRTRESMKKFNIEPASNIKIIDPIGFLEMIWLESQCKCVATDSGGVQKEAYFLQKPCITLREETEWTELVDTGWNVLVGTNSSSIKHAIQNAKVPGPLENLYGSGNAASLILSTLLGEDR